MPRDILPAQTNTLTTLAAIHALTNAQAEANIPVEFEATVTYYRDYERTLFVQDGDAAIFVLATTGLKLMPGDRVRVRGHDRAELPAHRGQQQHPTAGPWLHAHGGRGQLR